DLRGVDHHPVLSGHHEYAAGIERIVFLIDAVEVPAHAVDQRAGNALYSCRDCEDVAPDCAIHAAIIIENDDVAGPDLIDIVADCALRLADRHIAHRIGRSDHAAAFAHRRDAETSGCDAELVAGIRDGGGGEAGKGLDELRVGIFGGHFFSMFS